MRPLLIAIPYSLTIGQNDFFLAGSEDGSVCMYSLESYTYEKLLTRCTLPIRDIVLSPDGQWAAIASESDADRVSTEVMC